MVKRFCGLLYREETVYQQARVRLESYWGRVDDEAGPWPFTFTRYYEPEMGPELKRKFLSFQELVSPENGFSWKILTNELEQEFLTRQRQRQVNLDPGYLDLARVVLFTTKDFSHRIYMSQGIYAEITLLFHQGKFQPLPWTYPDYQTEQYLKFFSWVREKYRQQIKSG